MYNAYLNREGVSVTPSDTAQVFFNTVYVGGTGALTVTGEDGVDVTFPLINGGQFVPMRVTRIKATGTTATIIVGLI